jgi:hypothetical protein
MTTAWKRQVGRRVTGVVSIGLAMCLTATAAWGQSRCTSDKYKAAGKYALALAVCHSKAVAGGVPVDPICEGKGLTKLQASFVKAESKGDCVVPGGQSDAAAIAQKFVGDLGGVLEVQVFCCNAGPGLCLYASDAADCASNGGTLGAAGTVCDGASGACVAAPATGGNCCEGTVYGTGCVGGPGWNASTCTFFPNHIFSANAVCGASGSCVP